ncbi:hypothetical protein K3495_g12339 [Podosphaera aphanis]|nr:hypothetical protein K3495_g12339 [Podosphaera aphanis]
MRGNIQAPTFTPLSSSTPNTNEIMEAKDADGDMRMTGVNRTRAKWVSKKELDRRRVAGSCLRCGNHKHRMPACPQLPPLRPETAIKLADLVEDGLESFLEIQAEIKALKE